MKTIIIEDEDFAAKDLQAMITRLRPDTEVLEILESIEDAVEWFRNHRHPDLVFCDIHLSDGNSFEIFKQITIKSPVIFTTAYDEYAIEAFKVNSVHYLLKPIEKEELAKAIQKYEELTQSSLGGAMKNLQELLRSTASPTFNQEWKNRFMIKSGQSIKSVASEDIAYFMAEEGVVLLVTFGGKRFVVNYTLDQLEGLLDPEMFFRANRKLITHIKAIEEVNPYFKGRLHLKVSPGISENQIISSGKAAAFKQWLGL